MSVYEEKYRIGWEEKARMRAEPVMLGRSKVVGGAESRELDVRKSDQAGRGSGKAGDIVS